MRNKIDKFSEFKDVNYRSSDIYKNIMGDNEKCCDRCTGKKGCACCKDCKCEMKFNDATGLAENINQINKVMKYIKSYKIFEFVEISDYKEWSKFTNKEFYQKIGEYFKSQELHDKNFNRIYYDLEVNHDLFKVEIPDEITDFFNWYGQGNSMRIKDYNKGICTDKDGREIKIGKLLRKLGEEKLLQTYNKSKTNSLKDVSDLQVVISRHPYDIIGMSTNRGWTTCHDLNDTRYNGDHLHNVRSCLRNGVLIAYLIRKSDKNIKNPISRCLIKKSYGSSKIKLKPDYHIYGTYVNEFEKFLKKWCSVYNIDWSWKT